MTQVLNKVHAKSSSRSNISGQKNTQQSYNTIIPYIKYFIQDGEI
uniref:Uncharacterized protein n=1 Tax=viral metagenome TaxID=1070528 RepID=A0A6C0KLW4_9ZZZZ